MVKVAIILGSEGDRKVGDIAYQLLKELDVECDYRVLSAHRNPKALEEYVESCEAEVFIAVAGLSAALPGFIAARTVKPVVGVPRDVRLGGIDALLSMAQMPSGVPVACVGIDNAKNAALLSVEILALEDKNLRKKLTQYRNTMNQNP